MTIIDVDAHFEPVRNWLDEFPDLKARMPAKFPQHDPRFVMREAENFAFFLSDDLLRHIPPEDRMPIEDLTEPYCSFMFDVNASDAAELGFQGATMHAEFVDASKRIAWLDEQGISKQNVISGTGYGYARVIDDPQLGMETLEALNTWMSDRTADHADRLMPVCTLRWEDPDWVVKEMTRMRERGSRFFLINAEPVNNVPSTDPMYDKVWDAAVDLGMVGQIHVGMSPRMFHPGWAYVKDPMVIRVLAAHHRSQAVEVWLLAWIMSGHFDRHPNLSIVMAEQGVDWVEPLTKGMDQITAPGVSKAIVAGHYTAKHKPSDYMRRNIRIAPLPTPAFNPVPLSNYLPECGVYSSDYPHFEGSDKPTEYYEEAFRLDGTPEAMEAMMSTNILESFKMMGDPLL